MSLIIKSNKWVLQKVVWIYNGAKININERRFVRYTTSYKCDCHFDTIALIKDNV